MGNASFKLNLTTRSGIVPFSNFYLTPHFEHDQASMSELNMFLSNKNLKINEWLQKMDANVHAELVQAVSKEFITIFKNDAGWTAQGSTSSIPNYAEAVKLLKDDLKNLK